MARFGLAGASTIPPPLQGFSSNGESTQAKTGARFFHRFAVYPTDTHAIFFSALRASVARLSLVSLYYT
jgi:hypothetical protein